MRVVTAEYNEKDDQLLNIEVKSQSLDERYKYL